MTQIARMLFVTRSRMLCFVQKLSSTCSPFPANANVLHFHVNRLPVYHTSFVVARNGHSVNKLIVRLTISEDPVDVPFDIGPNAIL